MDRREESSGDESSRAYWKREGRCLVRPRFDPCRSLTRSLFHVATICGTCCVLRLVRYDKLKEDFKFNLGLIEDRDAELGRLEATVQELKDCLRDKVYLHSLTESNVARRPSRLGVLVCSE